MYYNIIDVRDLVAHRLAAESLLNTETLGGSRYTCMAPAVYRDKIGTDIVDIIRKAARKFRWQTGNRDQ